jgi:hypothetical protein
MRVLMVNAFHWLKGGVERTLFDETRWLEAAGHEVAHFATADPRNLPSRFSRHFAPAADFSEDVPAWRQLPQLPRSIWSGARRTCDRGPARGVAAGRGARARAEPSPHALGARRRCSARRAAGDDAPRLQAVVHESPAVRTRRACASAAAGDITGTRRPWAVSSTRT